MQKAKSVKSPKGVKPASTAKKEEETSKTPKAPKIQYGAAALAKEMNVSPQKVRQLLRKQAGGTLEKGSRYNFNDEKTMKAKASELMGLMKSSKKKDSGDSGDLEE